MEIDLSFLCVFLFAPVQFSYFLSRISSKVTGLKPVTLPFFLITDNDKHCVFYLFLGTLILLIYPIPLCA